MKLSSRWTATSEQSHLYAAEFASGCQGIVFDELKPPLSGREARVEARRCLECGEQYAQAPCIAACPTGIDIPDFIGAIARGRPDDAARTIYAENMLATSCARVCPVEQLCEGACVLTAEGRRPVEIGRLQRYAGEYGLGNGIPLFEKRAEASGKRVAVIGGGDPPVSLVRPRRRVTVMP